MSGDRGSELGRFLRAKRAQVQPESVGLSGATRRRVPGLRRDEVARLSGISTEYYVRLEQGRDQNPSAQVLQALAAALRLDGEATAHLYRLSRPLPEDRRAYRQNVSPMVQRLLASWSVTPALVLDHLGTVLAANTVATLLSAAHRPGTNLLRAMFLDPDIKGLYPDWATETEALVAAVRPAVGASGSDPSLRLLVEELRAHSERFRELWDAHEIRARASGISVFDHPEVGTLELHYERLAVLSATGPCPDSAGQYLMVFEAEPGSVSAHRLASLAGKADAGPRAPAPASSEHGVVVG
jgi:transcriptional regulator with XRE-family HTH domain